MPITNVFAVLTVTDLDAALAWYERVFGRPADSIPMDGLAEWHLTGSGGIQLARDADRSGTTNATIIVDDLENQVADLEKRSIAAGSITTGDKARFVIMTDREGNTITFAETINTVG